jgi:aminoglycoside 2'-N-acetyltransferase I
MDIEFFLKDELTPVQRRDLTALMEEAFKDDGDHGYAWAQPNMHALGYANRKLACNAGILDREILVGDRRIFVAGVTDVATNVFFRGQGCAQIVMKAVENHLKMEGRYRFALLFCNAGLLPLYESCGYCRIEAPLFIHSDGRRMRIDEIKMFLPLTGEEWPQGEIDLLGLPW